MSCTHTCAHRLFDDDSDLNQGVFAETIRQQHLNETLDFYQVAHHPLGLAGACIYWECMQSSGIPSCVQWCWRSILICACLSLPFAPIAGLSMIAESCSSATSFHPGSYALCSAYDVAYTHTHAPRSKDHELQDLPFYYNYS